VTYTYVRYFFTYFNTKVTHPRRDLMKCVSVISNTEMETLWLGLKTCFSSLTRKMHLENSFTLWTWRCKRIFCCSWIEKFYFAPWLLRINFSSSDAWVDGNSPSSSERSSFTIFLLTFNVSSRHNRRKDGKKIIRREIYNCDPMNWHWTEIEFMSVDNTSLLSIIHLGLSWS